MNEHFASSPSNAVDNPSADAAGSKTIPTVSLYGIPVSKLNMKETVHVLSNAIKRRQIHHIITANPIMLMTALDQPEYHKMMRSAELIVPDGTGVVWAAEYVGEPVKERVTGIDLVNELMKAGELERWRVYLLGATTEVIEAAANRLQSRFPAIRIVGYRDGYFEPEEDQAVIEAIRDTQPDILLVGRSASTQEPWIAKYKHELQIPVVMGVGGTFDVLSGRLKRAPRLFQRLRLEWLFRLLQEPSRFKRMLVLPKFALKVMRDREKVLKSR